MELRGNGAMNQYLERVESDKALRNKNMKVLVLEFRRKWWSSVECRYFTKPQLGNDGREVHNITTQTVHEEVATFKIF